MILGIIGPNGAGKTTLFNLLNGFLRPEQRPGAARRPGHRSAASRTELCALGVGRTFQIMRPFARMTVADNVVVGAYVRAATDEEATPPRRRGDRAGRPAPTSRPLAARADHQAAAPDGARPRARRPAAPAAARRDAGRARPGEIEEVLAVIRRLAADGITIVIIEHTMHAMVRLADHFVVLDHGAVLVDGAPEEVTRDPRVIEAYLGKKWSAPMLRLEGIHAGYCGGAGAARRVARASTQGSSSRSSAPTAPARPRCSRPSPASSSRAPGRIRFEGVDLLRVAAGAAAASRHRPRAGGPPGLPVAHRDGEPRDGRLHRAGRRDWKREPRAHLRTGCRCWPSGATSSPARCRAASSRCWRSAAASPPRRSC